MIHFGGITANLLITQHDVLEADERIALDIDKFSLDLFQ
jgi:hypothetical protein